MITRLAIAKVFLLFSLLGSVSSFGEVRMESQVSQFGITWTFDRAYPVGQFITGDWWVLGPVEIVGVSPKPGPVSEDSYEAAANRWGDKALKADPRMRNGSMIVDRHSGKVGYDSRSPNFSSALSLSFPMELKPNQSLVSSESFEIPGGQNLAHPIMWAGEKNSTNVLKTAAILTCLDRAPAADAFRPAYCGTEKVIYRESSIVWDRLKDLAPRGPRPDWKQLERYFERPWLDHTAHWSIQSLGPAENNPIYGREFARLTGLAALALNTKAPREKKRRTLIGLIQYGIDLQGFIAVGGNWQADGGHFSGRKLPLLFAGFMLGEDSLTRPSPSVRFQEDQDTYYEETYFGAAVSFQMGTHHGPRAPYEHKFPSEWDAFDRRSESYRRCCNGKAWIATALAVRIMGGVDSWNHDAFFDYCDRWMRQDDPYADRRNGYKRPREEGSSYELFVDRMWAKYRSSTEQPMAGHSRRWMWTSKNGKVSGPGYWVDDPRPEELE